MSQKLRLLKEYKGKRAGTMYVADNNEAHTMIEAGIASRIIDFRNESDKMMTPSRKKTVKTK